MNFCLLYSFTISLNLFLHAEQLLFSWLCWKVALSHSLIHSLSTCWPTFVFMSHVSCLPQNRGIDTKITFLSFSEPKLRPFFWTFEWPWMAENGDFGHMGQSEVSQNGPNEFALPQNLGIDTKINSLACSEQKLQIWPYIWLISYI